MSRSLSFPRACLAGLLVGCSGKATINLDSGETADTGPELPTDDSLCGAWSGFDVEGRVWTYDWVSGGQTGSSTTTLLDLDPVGQTAETRTELHITGDAYSFDSSATLTYVCDESGLALGTQLSEWQTESQGYITDDWLLTSYNPPFLAVARGLEAGLSWEGSTERQVEGGTTVAATEALSWSMIAGTTEEVTVPAGTYPALRVDVTGGVAVTSWYAEGVGLVRTGDLELNNLADD